MKPKAANENFLLIVYLRTISVICDCLYVLNVQSKPFLCVYVSIHYQYLSSDAVCLRFNFTCFFFFKFFNLESDMAMKRKLNKNQCYVLKSGAK